MTAANIDLVRAIYEFWEHGDFSRTSEWAHPEIECASFGGPVTGPTWARPRSRRGGGRCSRPSTSARPERRSTATSTRSAFWSWAACVGGRRRRGPCRSAAREPVPHPRGQGRQADLLLGPRSRVRRTLASRLTRRARRPHVYARAPRPSRYRARRVSVPIDAKRSNAYRVRGPRWTRSSWSDLQSNRRCCSTRANTRCGSRRSRSRTRACRSGRFALSSVATATVKGLPRDVRFS